MLCIFLGVLTEEQKNLVEQIFQTHHVKFINISCKIVKTEPLANDAVATAYLKTVHSMYQVMYTISGLGALLKQHSLTVLSTVMASHSCFTAKQTPNLQ